MYLCDIFESFKKREKIEKENRWRKILLGTANCRYYLDGYCTLTRQYFYMIGDYYPVMFMKKCDGKCSYYEPRKEV